jgi:hypothetical protein
VKKAELALRSAYALPIKASGDLKLSTAFNRLISQAITYQLLSLKRVRFSRYRRIVVKKSNKGHLNKFLDI